MPGLVVHAMINAPASLAHRAPSLILRTPLGILAPLLMLAACQQQPDQGSAKQPAAQVTNAAAVEEGELRAQAAGTALIGKQAPSIRLTTIDGSEIDLATLYGKRPVYLKFWATWCIPCRQQMPKFERIFEAHHANIEVIAVNTGFNDDLDHIRAFRSQYGLKMPIVMDDGRLARVLNLQVTPQHVVIDRTGKITFVGNLDGDKLDAALAHAEASVAATVAPMTHSAAVQPFKIGERVSGLANFGIQPRKDSAGRRRPRAVLFFSTWCESYLAKSRPESSKACRAARLTADKMVDAMPGVDWVGIAGGPWSTAQKDLDAYLTETKPRFAVALDTTGDVFRRFGVSQVPSVALISPDGRLEKIVPPAGDILAALRASFPAAGKSSARRATCATHL